MLKGKDTLKGGLYYYDPENHVLIRLVDDYDEQQLMFALDSETLIHGASAVIVISADLRRQSRKYSNRGYRYSMIEAGHVAQNIGLAVTECGLNSLEYGGFIDKALSELLGLEDRNEVPVLCVAVGKATTDTLQVDDASSVRREIEEALVGKNRPINWAHPVIREDSVELSFHRALAHYKPGKHQNPRKTYRSRLAMGTGESSELARVKAIAEAYERHCCGQIFVDRVASANELDSAWIDPNRYVPFTRSQLLHLGFEEFSPEEQWQWVKGESVSGGAVYVPIDMVFYPFSATGFNRRNCYSAHSNGVAAHTSLDEAKLLAISELVERDAIIRNWLTKIVPSRIPSELLPTRWRKKVDYWHNLGWNIDIVNLSHSGIVTLCVFARAHSKLPFMSHGSATSHLSADLALKKAFHELEVGLSANRRRKPKPLRPEEVDTPHDHGTLFFYEDYADELEYLFKGDYSGVLPQAGEIDLLSQFNPVFVKVSPEHTPLYVIRATSDKLLPINFGYGRDHVAHHLVKDAVSQEQIPFPHYLA